MSDPRCLRCDRLITVTDPGGLLISPPSRRFNDEWWSVGKAHICALCWPALCAWVRGRGRGAA